jgi:glycosyltransferase involved in cell wall biosynthesis
MTATLTPEPLDVVVINDFAHIRGGSDRAALESAVGLARAGHRVLLFTAVGPVAPHLLEEPGLEVRCLGANDILGDQSRVRAAINGIWNQQAADALRRALATFDPSRTILHLHGYTKALSMAVPRAAVKLGFRIVLSLHDYFLTCPNGAYFVHPRLEPCNLRPLSGACFACNCDARKRSHKLWRFTRAWMQNRIVKMPSLFSHVIAVSETCRRTARTMLPPNIPISTVLYPVDAEYDDPLTVEKNTAFVFVGRLERNKGAHLFAAASARLGVEAVFCGKGPAEAEIKALNPKARITGWLDRDALRREVSRARAVVFTSLWAETFGLVVAESLARGVPVIASRGTAAEEQIEHEINGLLFERGSVDSLAASIERLADPVYAQKLGRAAHARWWEQPLTLARHVAALEEIYATALKPASVLRA